MVAGGGSALVHASAGLEDGLGFTGDEKTGVEVVRRALAEPLRWIARNAGFEGGVVAARVAGMEPGSGFDAAEGDYGDLVERGILDPVKVTRSAVANAVSIAGLALTTETLVVEKQEDDDEDAHGHGHAH